jgi:iron complex outermembrane receptor protein
LTVEAGTTTRVSITMQPEAVSMRGVKVTALRPSLEPSDQLAEDQIRKAEVADPGALLRTLPGVDAVRRGPLGLDPNVRGLSETEVGVYVGGLRTFPAGPGRMDSPLSHIDPSTIKSIDVVKGPYALTWGPGNMSAIRVTQRGEDPPRTPLTGALHTGYDTNREATETTAFAMGRQGRWFYSANGAWRRGNDFEAGNDQTIGGDYSSAEGRGRIGVALTEASSLSLTGSYQDQNDLDYPGRLLHAEYFETGMGQLKYTLDRDDGTVRSVEARVGAQQTLHKMTNQGKPSYDMGMRIRVPTEVQNFNGRVAADLVPVPDWRFTLGADVVHTFRDATRYRTMVDMDMVNREKAWPGATITQAGVFAKARRTVGDLTLTGTTRLDLAQADVNDPTDAFRQNVGVGTDLQQNDAMLSGSVTASLPLSGRWALSLGAGSVARPADATERYAERFPSSKSQMSAEFLGTPSLDPERSTQADLWLDGRGSWWSLSVNGFARRIDDYITFRKAVDIDPILPMNKQMDRPVFRYMNGEATFVGSEVSAAVEPLRTVTLRASGSYLWGRDETLDEPAFGVAPPSATVGLRWSPQIGVRPLSNVYLDGSVHLTAEQDRVASTRGEAATDGYTTVDLQVGAQVLRRVELTAGVENLFDVTYTNHLNAKNPFSGAQLPEPGRVLTTNLTVQF